MSTLRLALTSVLLLAVARAQEPPSPSGQRFRTYNLFWPNDTDINNVTYPCTYVSIVTLAGTRLVALGCCNTSPKACNGYHALPPKQRFLQATVDSGVCIKTSDDNGVTWSVMRRIPGLGVGGILYDEHSGNIIVQFPDRATGAIMQSTSPDRGDTWTKFVNLTRYLMPGFNPDRGPETHLTVGPGAGLVLSTGRLMFCGHHGAYEYVMCWYSDDHAQTWKLSVNATTSGPARLVGLDEPALAETPTGGVIVRARNKEFHGPGKCDCRGAALSKDGGASFQGGIGFDAGLPEPICQGTMLNDRGTGKIFSAMPGYGTDTEKKDAHDGRGNGIVRWSADGGDTWPGAAMLWPGHAYSYSCLTRVNMPGYIGLVWETVLDTGHKRDISANNIVFSIIPTNFTSDGSLLV